jgi:hypothetical protein
MSGSTRFFTATALSLILAKPERGARLQAGEDLVEIVAARDAPEALAVERVEVDVETAQAGFVERPGASGSSSTPLVVSARSRCPEWPPGGGSAAAGRGAPAARRR